MQRDGFIKIAKFFDPEYLREYKSKITDSAVYRSWEQDRRERSDSEDEKSTTAVNATRMHYRNDSDLAEQLFVELNADPEFRKTLTAVTQRHLLRINNHAYEIVAGKGALDWHVGYYSFSFTRAEDYGCTLWVPLDPITPEQRGGMQYISRNILNGSFLYRFAEWHFEMLREQSSGARYLELATSNECLINVIGQLVEFSARPRHIIEDTFEIGDAFMFDKNVLHRSSPFTLGKLRTRLALICRYVESDARYDRQRFFSTFAHLHKSAESSAPGSEASAAPEPDAPSETEETIAPADPFLRELASSGAKHLSPLRDAAPLARELSDRIMLRA